MTITMEEAEKIAEEFFQRKNYEEIEVHSCKPIPYGGWIVTSRGRIVKSGKPRVDILEANVNNKGEVASYEIEPGPG